MKKQVKIIISVIIIVGLLIAIVSIFYPPASKNQTSGTFGKADKYHKSQMTEKGRPA